MREPHRRGRYAVALGMLLASCPCAFALNPALDVSQYAHTAWKIREGFSKGAINDIVQTSDGYLWLGTTFGLLRFDGVRNVPWQPPQDQHLPSTDISKLVAARDGTLWIGTRNGLASWKNGKLTQYAELAGLYVGKLLENREGSIWAGAIGLPSGKLCEIHNGSIRCFPEMGGLGRGVSGLHEDGKGNLWVGLLTGVWRWKPGSPKFYAVPGQLNGIQGIADGEDGALLLSMPGGVRRLVDGKPQMAYPFPDTVRSFQANRMLRDRDGGLWVGTSGRGIVHVHQGRTDVFSQSDGLTSDDTGRFFEDREGNIWVATVNGLDRFRELPVVTYTVGQGLSSAPSGAVWAARDGRIWFGTRDGLNRLSNGQVTVYRQRSARARAGVREIAPSGLPDHVQSLFQDSRGRIWVATATGIGYLESDRFISKAAPGGKVFTNVHALTEDGAGNLWIANQELGLFRLSPRNELQQIPWATFRREDAARPLEPDPLQGGLWLGFFKGGIAWFRDGQVRASYSNADGLGEGRVNQLRFDGEGALWAATEGGLSRLKDGRIATLTSKNGLPCDAVHWAMEDDAQSVWLMMPCGLVRVARPEVDDWAAAVDKAGRTLQTTVFDSSDGVKVAGDAFGYNPRVAKSPDGKLWFVVADGISVVDPRHVPFNKLPPPVHIEQITADRKAYDVPSKGYLRLPPRIRDLEIDYTALSFADPEKIRFRYKLEGRDSDWQDAGNRRQAFYNDLPPRNYRFRVSACNNSGVWNEAGTFLDFSIASAYYQTTWFRLSCVAAFLALLGGLYRLRLLYLTRQLNMRMEERVSERTRVARDLHDTLLQSFQGVLLRFHAVTFLLPDRPAEAGKTLESVIEQARQAIAEGREAIQGLRSSAVITNDLARAITTFGEELAPHRDGQNSPEFLVHVEGTPRDLAPLVRDEVYRIAGEALHNAFLHAHAGRIEVEIRYDQRQLRLRIRDNGKGIDPQVLNEGGRAGHHGLPGMYERAKLVGSKLAVWSELDAGTEIEVAIPAAVAYAKTPVARRWPASGKGPP